MRNLKFWKKFIKWRLISSNNFYFLLFLSILTGFGAGLLAIVIKISVHQISLFAEKITELFENNYLYLIYPIIGISLVLVFANYIIKQKIGHGIPGILYSISRNNAYIKKHNLYSSIVASALTVGFGGSVGLEGPVVSTGAAVGSTFGGLFKIDYKQKIILIGAACAGAMASIFKAPIAGVVFALEVIMIDLTTYSIIPILLASVSGSLTSYLASGTNFLYSFTLQDAFEVSQLPYFIILGIVSGFTAVYYTIVYIKISKIFEKIKKPIKRLLIGSILLGLLIFLFPALYGEGYEYINYTLQGDYHQLFDNFIFNFNQDNIITLILLLLILILLKTVAASFTFGAGGVGGVFAPTLFTGVNTGLITAAVAKSMGYNISYSNSALIGMAGLIAGVLHAPLTGIFMIGELTGGYGLLFPLMVTSTVSYIIVRVFQKNNLYTFQLAKRKQLLTHHADKNILTLLKTENIIETDFNTLNPEQNLGDIVKVISESNRNFFPVVDYNNHFLGLVSMDRVRKIIFKPDLYSKIKVKEIMFVPDNVIDDSEIHPENIAEKLQRSGVFNIVVIKEGKYLGFISRANFFSHYRTLLKQFSSD